MRREFSPEDGVNEALAALAFHLAAWIQDSAYHAALASAINQALTEYANDRQSRVEMMGKSSAVATDSLLGSVAQMAVNGAKTVVSAVADATLSDSAVLLRRKYPEITADNAQAVFLYLQELKSGWATENHAGLFGGRASLKTKIVCAVVDCLLSKPTKPEEENLSIAALEEKFQISRVPQQAEKIYFEMLGALAALQRLSQTTAVAK